ncbi:hypothetical protein DIPPA_01586 [Diplonema papillatum]|nr:hypothetical protein DIPPA_01586 [Diplonema papillatum]
MSISKVKPEGEWAFLCKGETSFRSLEWGLKLWSDKTFEHGYTTSANGQTGTLMRRGSWEVADNRLFCTVEGKLTISRGADGPPDFHAQAVKAHEQLVFDVGAGSNELTSSDENSPIGAPVLKAVSHSKSLRDLLADFSSPMPSFDDCCGRDEENEEKPFGVTGELC